MTDKEILDRKHKVAIIVLSCDKYSDLWDPFFNLFFSNWPMCPYSVYLFSNEIDYKRKKVTTILSGKDFDWTRSVRKCIEQISCEYLFFFLEDAFIISKVDSIAVEEIVNNAILEDVNYVRLRPSPPPDRTYNDDYGLIARDAMYRTSLFASIWKRDVFLDILQDGESAWAFEIQGTERSRKYNKFYSTWKNYFSYLHVVENGCYISKSVNILKAKGIILNTENRKLIHEWEYRFERYIAASAKKTMAFLPRGLMLKIKNIAYRIFPLLKKFKKNI